MPREAGKKLVGVPLISKTKVAEEIQPIIQFPTDLNQDKANKGPIYPVKSLYEVKLKDKCTEIF